MSDFTPTKVAISLEEVMRPLAEETRRRDQKRPLQEGLKNEKTRARDSVSVRVFSFHRSDRFFVLRSLGRHDGGHEADWVGDDLVGKLFQTLTGSVDDVPLRAVYGDGVGYGGVLGTVISEGGKELDVIRLILYGKVSGNFVPPFFGLLLGRGDYESGSGKLFDIEEVGALEMGLKHRLHISLLVEIDEGIHIHFEAAAKDLPRGGVACDFAGEESEGSDVLRVYYDFGTLPVYEALCGIDGKGDGIRIGNGGDFLCSRSGRFALLVLFSATGSEEQRGGDEGKVEGLCVHLSDVH